MTHHCVVICTGADRYQRHAAPVSEHADDALGALALAEALGFAQGATFRYGVTADTDPETASKAWRSSPIHWLGTVEL